MKKLFMFAVLFLVALFSVNAQPTLPALGPYTVDENAQLTIDIVLAANSDNGSTNWWTDASYLSLSSSNATHATYTWTPGYDANANSPYIVMFNASDDNSTHSTTATINVDNVNRAPAFASTPVTTGMVGHEYVYNATATDSDGQTLTYSLADGPSGMAIDSSSGIVTWTPTVVATYAVNLSVTDGADSVNQAYEIVVSAQTPGISISDVTLGSSDQEREENTSATLTVTNSGSETLIGINVSVSAHSDYQLSLSQTTVATLAAGETTTITVEGYVPDDQDSGREDIGGFSAQSSASGVVVTASSQLYMQAENNLEIRDLEVTVNGNDDNMDDGDSIDVYPAATISMLFEIKNTHSDLNMEDITIEVYNDDLDINEDDDISKIKDGKTDDSVLIEFELDDDAEEDDYTIEITVEGEDENGAIHSDYWEIEFNLNEEGIIITSATLTPDNLRCDQDSMKLEIDLFNVGTRDEDEASVEIFADSIDYEKRISYMEIPEDEDITRTFDISIPEDAIPGDHVVEIKAFMNNDELTHTRYVYYSIPSSCPADSGTDNNNGIDVNPGDDSSDTGNDTTGDDDGFIDSNTGSGLTSVTDLGSWGTALLVLANILVLVIIIILVVKFLVRA